MSEALEFLVLAALKEVRVEGARWHEDRAVGEFVLYEEAGGCGPVTLPLTALLGAPVDLGVLKRSKLTLRFEPLEEGEEMRWDTPEKLTAACLLEILEEVCEPGPDQSVISFAVRGGRIFLHQLGLAKHRHVPLELNTAAMDDPKFLRRALWDARYALDGYRKGGEG